MRRAFTLVELLVVVAVIGLLAALLLPVLGRARVAAGRATCINNLHQINLSLIMYANDHADSLRAATNDFQIYFTYREDINSYLSRNGSSTNDQLFGCPSDTFDCTKSLIEDFFYPHPTSGRGFHHLKQTDYSSYIFNGEAAGSADTRVTRKAFASVRQPSRLVLVSEFSAALGLSGHAPQGLQQCNNAKNVLTFIDGHVGYIPMYWNGNSGIENIPCHYNPPAGYDYVWFDQ
jgi:prepilin-type N-terminal cleavage/methylation domain-containing protein